MTDMTALHHGAPQGRESTVTGVTKMARITETELVERAAHVLIVEDDQDLAAVVQSILEEEGLITVRLRPGTEAALQEAATRLRPRCILLDGAGRAGYGRSWSDAAWLHAHLPAIPVLMFSADAMATREAQEDASSRSQAAAFAGILNKPFEIDELIGLVTRTISQNQAILS